MQSQLLACLLSHAAVPAQDTKCCSESAGGYDGYFRRSAATAAAAAASSGCLSSLHFASRHEQLLLAIFIDSYL